MDPERIGSSDQIRLSNHSTIRTLVRLRLKWPMVADGQLNKKMKNSRLSISRCHANCPKCGIPTDDFKMFESGPGGDFETYVGAESGNIYRLDLGKVHYQGQSRADLLADAMKKEGSLLCIPKDLKCKICGTVFGATNIPIDGEEIVDAFEV